MWRQIASIVALLVAGVATIATTAGPQGVAVSDSETFEIALSADHPYELRKVDVLVEHGGVRPDGVTLAAYAETAGPDAYWVAVLPLATDEPVRPWYETMTYRDGGQEPFKLDDWCHDDCQRSYLLVVGLGKGTASLNADLEVILSSFYGFDRGSPRAGTNASLEVSESQADVMGTAEIRSTAAGRLDIAPGSEPVWRGSLHVSGAPDVKTGVGLLELHFDATMSDAKANAQVAISVGGAYILVESMYNERVTDLVTVEWLDACHGKAECDVPIELETDWDPSPESTDLARQTGSVTVNFTIDARLVFIGQSTVPGDASLELLAQ